MCREIKESYKLGYRWRCWRCTRARDERQKTLSPLAKTFLLGEKGRLLRRQTWSFGCLSRKTKRIHVELIPDKTRATLDPIVEGNLEQGSFIMPDMHRAYMSIDLRLGMRGHAVVNHSIQFVNGTVAIPVDPALGGASPVPPTSVLRCTPTLWSGSGWSLSATAARAGMNAALSGTWANICTEIMSNEKNVLRRLPSDAARFRRLLRDIHRVYPGYGRRGFKIRRCRCSPNCPPTTTTGQ
ncbi:unnamed protein product [Plutella xylostella]|uniref:(diamondback moth) hypothetical protein n=1 Tax=Plutella xylostella TaxID=51655 RepID=A0A8S4GC11_PLUXY|nr:unnamed protein product [Plutella xylostella]